MNQESKLIETKTNQFRFAHLADLHLGSWRNNSLRELSTKAFDKAIQVCIEEQYDFVLFAGDIFNTSLPAIDIVNHVAQKLQELKAAKIPLYAIPGSHDFSPTGRSMIDVLESAGLLINVCRGRVDPDTKQLELKQTIDKKTGAKITGILGRRGMLDRSYYENLKRETLEHSCGYKIFMFHTTLTELKPKQLEMIDSQPASFLPKHQHYYAGGHIHHKTLVEIPGYGPMTYTGALFPNNFAELEKYSFGGFYQVTVNKRDNQFEQEIKWLPLKIKEHISLFIQCTGKSPEQIQLEFLEKIQKEEIKNKIVTLRLAGNIGNHSLKDIKTQEMIQLAEERDAFILLVNNSKIQTQSFTEKSLAQELSAEDIELAIIKEQINQSSPHAKEELQKIQDLMQSLDTSKQEGEKSYDFTTRVLDSCRTILQNHTNNNVQKENP